MADPKHRPGPKPPKRSADTTSSEELLRRLQEAEESLQAIRSGEVDALVIPGPHGDQVYTIRDADRPYRFIIERMLEGTVTLDAEGMILFANRQFAAMLGLPLSGVIGSVIYNHISSSGRDALRPVLSRARHVGARAEIDLADKAGRVVSTYASFGPVKIDGTTVISGVFMDITEEKRTTARLQSTTALLERIFEGTHFLMASLDRSLRFLRVNANFARALGRTAESLMGKSYDDIFPDSKYREVLVRVLKTGEAASFEAAAFEKELWPGQPSFWDWNVEPVRGSGEEIQSLILTLVDKTQQSLVELERRRLEAAIEQAVSGILITDLEGKVIYANRSARQILSELGQKAEDFDPNVFLGEQYAEIRSTLGHQESWRGQILRKRTNGQPFHLEATVSAVRDPEGRIDGTVVLLRDVTQSVKLEERVRQMERIEALGRLAGGVAHDLNNILQPVLVNMETLLEDAEPGSPQAERLRSVLLAAQRQKDLVRSILSFTRRTEPSRKPASFRRMLTEVMKLLGPSHPASIEVRLHQDADRDVVLCDPTEVHQVILNLCSNAVEAMEGQVGILEISLANVRLEKTDSELGLGPGEYLKLSVSDTGRGIAPDVLSHIFEPFFTTKEPGLGTGIGLSVVHGIMKSCGGAIEVESRLGQGTKAEAYFPLAGQVMAVTEAAAPADFKPSGERILLVDDESLVLDSLGPALRSRGFAVTTARDGSHAIEAFRTSPEGFDLAIIDQTMPHMTGTQVAAEILRLRPGMPIILATGFSARIDEAKASELGIREILIKPMSLRELTVGISRALGRRGNSNPKIK